MRRTQNNNSNNNAQSRGRRSRANKKFMPKHLKNVLNKRGGYGRRPGYGQVSAKRFKNKRITRVETNRFTTDDGKLITQEQVRDRPVDLYTDIYTDKVHQYSDSYEIDSNEIMFDAETLLNDTEHARTTIISDENEEETWSKNMLYIPMGRRCLDENVANEILDTGFEDLDTKHLERPQVPPTIKQYQIANIYRTFENGKEGQAAKLPMTDHGRAHVLDLLGRNKDPNSFKFSIRANHHLMIVIDAFNWYDSELDEENIEGITFKWIWTAGPTNYEKNDIDKIVGTSRMLSIENIQREHIGTYTCEVANKYGKKFSFPIDLDVERPGEMREVRLKVTSPNGEESEILTNQFEWIANDKSDEHDDNIKPTDNKQIYNFEEERWYALYWENSKDMWYKEEDNAPYAWEDSEPDILEFEGETNEDLDAGGMVDDSGYRV